VAAGFNAVPHVGQQLCHIVYVFRFGLGRASKRARSCRIDNIKINEAELELNDEGDGGELSPMSLAIPATRSGGATVFDIRSKASDSPTAIGNRPKSQLNSMARDIRTQNTTLRKGPPIMQPEAVGWSALRQLMQGNFQAHVVLYGHE
jgi:hypothetical protein